MLVLLDPASGRPVVTGTTLDRAIGGALLLDLARAGRVTADGDEARSLLTARTARRPATRSWTRRSVGWPGRPLRARHAVERLARRLREPVLDRLVERDAVTRSRARLLGVIPVTVWYPTPAGPGPRLRGEIAAVLAEGRRPADHLGAVIAMVHAVKAEHRIVPGPRKELRARAAAVARGDPAGSDVSRAVRDVQSSVLAAVAVAAAVGSSGAS